MGNKLTEVDLNRLTDIAYLDIIAKENSDLEEIYRRNKKEISLGDVIDYYLAQNRFANSPGLQELQDRFGGNYEEVRQLLEKMYDSTNPDYKQWKISNIVSNNKQDQSGFVAYTIEPEPNVAIVAFRGSEPLNKGNFNDWLNNFLTSYMLESPQQKEAREYIESLAKKQGIKELYLTGHSLGGNLANYASFNLPQELRDKLVGCSTWGAPGFNPEVLRKYATVIKELNKNKKYQRFCNPFDPTPSLFYQPTSPIFLKSDNPDGGILKNHSSFSLEETVDSYGNPIHQRSTVQVPSTLSLMVNKLSLSLEALPDPLKASLVHIIFSVWNGRLDSKDIMYLTLALRNIPILIGGLKLVATLVVVNIIVNELVPKQEVYIDSNNDAIQKELKEILKREKVDLISLLNRVIASGIGLGLVLDNFKKEAFSKVQAFFRRISKVIASNLSSKWDRGQTVSSFVKRPAPNHSLYDSAQLSVDLNRLKDLQRKMGSLERDFEESVEEALRDTKRMSSDVAREYPEFNVQQQIHEINRKLDQIRDCNRQVCNQMQSKVKGLRSAIDTYRVTELRLLKEVWD